jgi:hypothetical protein
MQELRLRLSAQKGKTEQGLAETLIHCRYLSYTLTICKKRTLSPAD